MNLFSRHQKLLHRLLLLAVFIAIGLYVLKNLEQLTSRSIHFGWKHLSYAVICTMFGHLVSYAIWMRIAASFDMRTSWPHAGKAWFLSRLGRYIPGKISILLLRFNAYAGHGKTKISAATIIEAYTSLCAASILILFLSFSSSLSDTPLKYVALVLIAIFFAISHPKALKYLLETLRRHLPIPTLEKQPAQTQIIAFTLAQLLTMLLHGGALFLTFNSIGDVSLNHYLLITAVFFAAGLIGMIAVFSPSGIGVREAILLAGLSPYVEPTTLLIGVVLIRLIGILSEILLTALFVFLQRTENR